MSDREKVEESVAEVFAVADASATDADQALADIGYLDEAETVTVEQIQQAANKELKAIRGAGTHQGRLDPAAREARKTKKARYLQNRAARAEANRNRSSLR